MSTLIHFSCQTHWDTIVDLKNPKISEDKGHRPKPRNLTLYSGEMWSQLRRRLSLECVFLQQPVRQWEAVVLVLMGDHGHVRGLWWWRRCLCVTQTACVQLIVDDTRGSPSWGSNNSIFQLKNQQAQINNPALPHAFVHRLCAFCIIQNIWKIPWLIDSREHMDV